MCVSNRVFTTIDTGKGTTFLTERKCSLMTNTNHSNHLEISDGDFAGWMAAAKADGQKQLSGKQQTATRKKKSEKHIV
jgi:hypothetical protein